MKHIIRRKITNVILFISITLFFAINWSYSSISENELSHYSSSILTQIIDENQESTDKIRQCLSGLLKDGASGIRLVDKLGIFLYDTHKRGISVEKTRFYSKNKQFSLFLVLKDKKDSQHYTLFLEYDYEADGKCVLRDVYFSLVFDEQLQEIRQFFGNR